MEPGTLYVSNYYYYYYYYYYIMLSNLGFGLKVQIAKRNWEDLKCSCHGNIVSLKNSDN